MEHIFNFEINLQDMEQATKTLYEAIEIIESLDLGGYVEFTLPLNGYEFYFSLQYGEIEYTKISYQ